MKIEIPEPALGRVGMAGLTALTDWLKTPQGLYLLDWERAQFDNTVGDIFGYHALQLGLPEIDALSANRMPHRWLALDTLPSTFPRTLETPALAEAIASLPQTVAPPSSSRRVAFLTDPGALPFPEASLDLVVLPHTLELGRDAHSTLREVQRVLVPEGRVVISGFNPVSLWGLGQKRRKLFQTRGLGIPDLPAVEEWIGYWRLRDWLRLLDFEVESAQFGCYLPTLTTQAWINRFRWLDAAGSRWWPIFGAVYFVAAVKRVHGVRLLEPAWKSRKATATAPAAIANLHQLDETACRLDTTSCIAGTK
jgi:SAM-dependent methyltransferase